MNGGRDEGGPPRRSARLRRRTADEERRPEEDVTAADGGADEIGEEWDSDEPGLDRHAAPVRDAGGHVSADVEWVASDEDDPDGGSGRTDADDGGYLPGEGTGRPY